MGGINLTPIIDISVVTFNSERAVDGFINSLLAQSYPTNKINLFITDNTSTDLTYEKLLDIQRKYGNVFNSFSVYLHRNLGYGNGHNNNIFRSNAEFVLATNVDLEFESDAISEAVGTALYDEDSVALWEFRQKPFENPKYYNPITLETTWVSNTCILFRRNALEMVGGYETKKNIFGEDIELSYRLRNNGYKLKYCPKAVCWHYTLNDENQIKPMTFLYNKLAIIYIRLRFGTLNDILIGLVMYLCLFSLEFFKGKRRILLSDSIKLLYNAFYFRLIRRNRTIKFGAYETVRDGEFYRNSKEKNGKLISIIMRTYGDRTGFLQEAITSVNNQTYNNLELIVVEDGSDRQEEFIRSLKSSNVHILYKSISKAGRCKAGNVGLSLANGEYLIFLDDDDLFFPDHLEVLVNEINKDQDISAVYSSAFEVSTKVICNNPLQYCEKSRAIIYCQEFSRPLLWYHNYIPIQAVLFKRKLYDQYGGFDEDLDNLEDWNLWTRYSLNNKFKFVNKTTSLYRVPADKETSQERQRILEQYYSAAVAKQEKLIFSTNPTQIIEYVKEINSFLNVFSISAASIKTIFKKYKVLNQFYNLSRKIYFKYKQRNRS